MPLTLNSNPSDIAKAYEAHVDRLHDEYYGEQYSECPWCGDESVSNSSGRSRRGWWVKSECVNDGCDYSFDDCDTYDD